MLLKIFITFFGDLTVQCFFHNLYALLVSVFELNYLFCALTLTMAAS